MKLARIRTAVSGDRRITGRLPYSVFTMEEIPVNSLPINSSCVGQPETVKNCRLSCDFLLQPLLGPRANNVIAKIKERRSRDGL